MNDAQAEKVARELFAQIGSSLVAGVPPIGTARAVLDSLAKMVELRLSTVFTGDDTDHAFELLASAVDGADLADIAGEPKRRRSELVTIAAVALALLAELKEG